MRDVGESGGVSSERGGMGNGVGGRAGRSEVSGASFGVWRFVWAVERGRLQEWLTCSRVGVYDGKAVDERRNISVGRSKRTRVTCDAGKCGGRWMSGVI